MASQYESLRDPFIIMFSVPTAAIGVVLALYLTGTSFNLQAYLGVIMLGGIVVSNGILLVDYTNILRRRDGMELREAVEVAGRTRLRPILMTALATMLGLVPDGPRHRRRQRAAGAVGARRHRRPSDLDLHYPGVRANGVYAVRRGLSGLRKKRPHPPQAAARATRPPLTQLNSRGAVTELSHGCAERSRRTQRQINRCAKYCLSPLLSQFSPAGATPTTTILRSRSLRRSIPRVSRAAISRRRSAPPARLQAVTTVQVGTQVSGTILELNADFNSLVRKGQVLARLDPSLFATQIEQARANLIRAEADLERFRVSLDDARTKLNRARELSEKKLIAQTELEAAEVAVRSAEAQLRSQQAAVTQSQASSAAESGQPGSIRSSSRRSTGSSFRETSTSGRRSRPACLRPRCSSSRRT